LTGLTKETSAAKKRFRALVDNMKITLTVGGLKPFTREGILDEKKVFFFSKALFR
jgi:hypothetical protein